MAYLTKKNADIYYEVYGDSDRWITLINGYTRPSSDFKLLGSYLAARGWRVLVFDNRGCGLTEGVLDFSIADIARDVVDLWNMLNIKRSHVLGVSMGGYIAQILALSEEQRLSSLCLVSTSTGARGFTERFDWPQDVAQILTRLEKFFHPNFATSSKLLLQAMAKAIANNNRDSSFDRNAKAQQSAMAKTRFSEETLSNLKLPVLVLHGRDDQIIPLAEALNIKNLISQAQLHVYEETGHLLLVEQKKDFYERVELFFQEHAKI